MTRPTIILDFHGTRTHLYLSEADGQIHVTLVNPDEAIAVSLDPEDVALVREWLASPDAGLNSDGTRFTNAFERRVEKYNEALRRALRRD